jgi:hypothetical protein
MALVSRKFEMDLQLAEGLISEVFQRYGNQELAKRKFESLIAPLRNFPNDYSTAEEVKYCMSKTCSALSHVISLFEFKTLESVTTAFSKLHTAAKYGNRGNVCFEQWNILCICCENDSSEDFLLQLAKYITWCFLSDPESRDRFLSYNTALYDRNRLLKCLVLYGILEECIETHQIGNFGKHADSMMNMLAQWYSEADVKDMILQAFDCVRPESAPEMLGIDSMEELSKMFKICAANSQQWIFPIISHLRAETLEERQKQITNFQHFFHMDRRFLPLFQTISNDTPKTVELYQLLSQLYAIKSTAFRAYIMFLYSANPHHAALFVEYITGGDKSKHWRERESSLACNYTAQFIANNFTNPVSKSNRTRRAVLFTWDELLTLD